MREITHTIDMEVIRARQERLDLIPGREPSASSEVKRTHSAPAASEKHAEAKQKKQKKK